MNEPIPILDPQPGDRVRINGIEYVAEIVLTPAELRRTDKKNVAAMMDEAGSVAQVYLRRPRGHRLFQIYVFASGAHSRLIPIR